MKTWARGLVFPEGPVLMPDGSVLLSELLGNRVVQIWEDGTKKVVAEPAGMPNGLAFGPDGYLYCANMGGLLEPERVTWLQGADTSRLKYRGGSIQRIDVRTGEVTDVVVEADGLPLRAPDDLIFDASGGFWFTDIGVSDASRRVTDETGIYYVPADMSSARRVVKSLTPTNGLGLSADGTKLYWTEYLTGRLFVREVVKPGVLAEPAVPFADCIFTHPLPITWFDSLTVMANGDVAVAVHNGTPQGRSGVVTFSAEGEEVAFEPFDDVFTTHVIYSVAGGPTAYVTLSATGRLVSLPARGHQVPPLYGPRA
jgi:gluconolactonase